jgi:hypothetical protein
LGVAVLLGLSACDGDTELIVRAATDAAVPIVGLEVAALPFDPDQILDSLAAVATTPRPTFPDLEAEMLAYQRPQSDQVDQVTRPWRALRDTAELLADSLNAADRSDPAYPAAYNRFRQLYQRLALRGAERDAALRRLNGDHRDLAQRAAAAAESLRTWEYETYSDYADVAAAALLREGRQVTEASTGPDGEARLTLPPGRWWVVARLTDPDNPFVEYYWSEPVTVTQMLPVRLPLGTGNRTRRWRH